MTMKLNQKDNVHVVKKAQKTQKIRNSRQIFAKSWSQTQIKMGVSEWFWKTGNYAQSIDKNSIN